MSVLLALFFLGGFEQAALDRVLVDFWQADDVSSRQKAAESILRHSPAFEDLYARLEAGRRYSSEVETGLIEESRKGANGMRQEYVFLVPEDYDASKRYRVCFYLHGGVNRLEPWKKGEDWWRRFDRFDGQEQISVFPSSWRGSLWWQSSQVENLEGILDRLKRDYNVDENRVYLFGVSDGGTGVYYHAAKSPTIWAAFFPFIGHPAVLGNPATGADGELFVENLSNRAMFVVNGEKDELYPVSAVKPFLDAFERAGAEIVFRPKPSGHNTRWWNGEREAIDGFIESHPRKPLPDHLVWETERTDRFARIQWLVVDELAPDANPPSGKLSVARNGNVIEVDSRGVARYRVLLSPRQFDLSQAVEVVTNGVSSFKGVLTPSSETLLRWAARDDDRTMLFGADVSVSVPSKD